MNKNNAKKEVNKTQKSLQVIDLKKNKENTPYGIILPKNKKYNSKNILRIHSQLIRSFVKGEIEQAEAKTLSYLCSNYLQALSQSELEQRLDEIENKVKGT